MADSGLGKGFINISSEGSGSTAFAGSWGYCLQGLALGGLAKADLVAQPGPWVLRLFKSIYDKQVLLALGLITLAEHCVRSGGSK